MRITPLFNKNLMNQPYMKGVQSGLLLGCGMTWTVLSIIHHLDINIIMGLLVFILGSVQYLIEIRNDYNFL